jgi:hypothetical protein
MPEDIHTYHVKVQIFYEKSDLTNENFNITPWEFDEFISDAELFKGDQVE